MGHPGNSPKQPPGKIENIAILSYIGGKVLFSGVFEMVAFFRTGAEFWMGMLEIDEIGI